MVLPSLIAVSCGKHLKERACRYKCQKWGSSKGGGAWPLRALTVEQLLLQTNRSKWISICNPGWGILDNSRTRGRDDGVREELEEEAEEREVRASLLILRFQPEHQDKGGWTDTTFVFFTAILSPHPYSCGQRFTSTHHRRNFNDFFFQGGMLYRINLQWPSEQELGYHPERARRINTGWNIHVHPH